MSMTIDPQGLYGSVFNLFRNTYMYVFKSLIRKRFLKYVRATFVIKLYWCSNSNTDRTVTEVNTCISVEMIENV